MHKKFARFSFSMLRRLPQREKKITLSTALTLLRIVLIPFIVVAMIGGYWGIAFGAFCIAVLSDLLDGNLARLLNQQTFLGACLDPIADKLLLLSCFFTLAFIQSPLFTIPLWFVFLVLLKELIVVAGAFIIYSYKGCIEIRPTLLGKLTTVVQMGFIIWLFACYFFKWLPIKTYYTMLGILITLVIFSFIQYAYIGFKMLTSYKWKNV